MQKNFKNIEDLLEASMKQVLVPRKDASSSFQNWIHLLGGHEFLLIMQIFGLLHIQENQKNFVPNRKFKKVFIILPHPKEIFIWQQKIEIFLKNSWPLKIQLCSLPSYSTWGSEKYLSHLEQQRRRMFTFQSLLDQDSCSIVLTTLPALAQRTLPPHVLVDNKLEVVVGQSYDMDQFKDRLQWIGYKEVLQVEEKGQYLLRGGILDIFPINEKNPIRIEFFADEIISLRFFSKDSQRSEESIESITIYPCSEFYLSPTQRKDSSQKIYEYLLDKNAKKEDISGILNALEHSENSSRIDAFHPMLRGEKSCIFDFVTHENSLFFSPSLFQKCLELFDSFKKDCEFHYEKDLEAQHPCLPFQDHFLNDLELVQNLNPFLKYELGNPVANSESETESLWRWTAQAPAEFDNTTADKKPFMIATEKLHEYLSRGGQCVILSDQIEKMKILAQMLGLASPDHESQKDNPFPHMFQNTRLSRSLQMAYGSIDRTHWDELSDVLILPDSFLLGRKKIQQESSHKRLKKAIAPTFDLNHHDFVVHTHHGVGRYHGISQLTIDGSLEEFILVSYRDADKLYLPIYKITDLKKYGDAGSNTEAPLDKLGGQTFRVKKEKIFQSIKDFSEELIQIQASRKMSKAYRYSSPSQMYQDFIDDFPYQETQDQIRSMNEIEADMSGFHIMDRLIIGDVGFGKTELALRACMRAILDGFQVLFLVPTTILCYQHYENFRFRLEKFGVRLSHLSRLVGKKEKESILESLGNGSLDLIIGTHRLLSSDIKPKNLGLLVIDEEQKFGVSHKERLKKLKSNVDVLSLSATPIPRTLHMSILGLKDVSALTSPPENRLPVKTVIAHYDQALIKTALESELRRGGQVFFVHNKIEDLDQISSSLKKLLPHAKIRSAHGQMAEEKLEPLIIDFLEQKFQILVCTTIIESGIDMPNVNTLIVNHADKYGISQLHQLRGRVGRSSTQGHAYFLFDKEKSINEDSLKRLEILDLHQELGAGFHIAHYDMGARGVGNLLGREQSGHVTSVGLDMYVEMLEEAIQQSNSDGQEKIYNPEIKIGIPAFAPSSFIPNERERIQIYRELFSASQAEEIWTLQESIQDRFGKIPQTFINLIKTAILRLQLLSIKARSLIRTDTKNNRFEIKFIALKSNESSSMEKIALQNSKNCLWSKNKSQLQLFFPSDPLAESSSNDFLDKISALLSRFLTDI
ncbi:MAG: transcription-repair coupling factor [Oligoflexales bacterium]|nr:transcription-repair coupling factor [Oligoflexales bacterium]